MGQGHFVSKTAGDFDWKGFQEHMGYSDEELKALQNDPKKSEHVQQICGPEMQDKYLIAEVVESHGCIAGMKPGDRIYFKGMSVLDPERSDPWCPYIVNTSELIVLYIYILRALYRVFPEIVDRGKPLSLIFSNFDTSQFYTAASGAPIRYYNQKWDKQGNKTP